MKAKYAYLLKHGDVKRWFDNLTARSYLTATVYLRNLGFYCELNETDPKALLKVNVRREQDTSTIASERIPNKEERKKVLKEILRQLHVGTSPEDVKERFRRFLEGVSSLEIAKIEQELVSEGVSREELQRLCDLAIFKEPLEKQKVEVAPPTPSTYFLKSIK